ncbi:MAG: ABC transporter ATP-binding protein [Planctomycetota bacterium]|nr:MAG: ABC transporter ATP-binding protein [Planctomycetota bacterium]
MGQDTSTADPLLQFDDVHVRFHARGATTDAVRGLSLRIDPGQVMALVGESGSGKSVSAMSALRLLPMPPASYPQGRILWRGEDVLTMNDQRLRRLRGKEIGIVFQEPMTSLNPTWTVGRQVDEALQLHTTLNAQQRRDRVVELFNDVGIPEASQRYDQYPHELSGGMRQRVCIAMALACDPELLIADEPTTALDVTIQAQILELLKRLQAERGMAVLFITHDLGVVAELADRVALMWRGKKVEEGPVRDIFADPQHPYTKGLLACRPRLGITRERLPTLDDFLTAAQVEQGPRV